VVTKITQRFSIRQTLARLFCAAAQAWPYAYLCQGFGTLKMPCL
jgi:hypothetical protein